MSTNQRNIVKISAMIAGAALTAAVLSGCGSDSDDANSAKSSGSSSYCKTLATAVEEHLPAGDADITDPDATFGALHELAKQSPDAVKADWKVIDDATQGMLEGLKDAGIKFDDLDAIFEGNLPDGVDMSALDALEPAFAAMTAPEYMAAQDKVQTHAKTECDVDLDLGTDDGSGAQ